MNANTQPIDINPEVRVTISAKLLWAGIICMVTIVGSVFITYYDMKATILRQDYEIKNMYYRIEQLEKYLPH